MRAIQHLTLQSNRASPSSDSALRRRFPALHASRLRLETTAAVVCGLHLTLLAPSPCESFKNAKIAPLRETDRLGDFSELETHPAARARCCRRRRRRRFVSSPVVPKDETCISVVVTSCRYRLPIPKLLLL